MGAVGDTDDVIDKFLSFGGGLSVVVNPICFASGKVGIGGDFDSGNDGPHRIAASGGKEDDMASCGGKDSTGDNIIAGTCNEVQAVGFEPSAVWQDINYGRSSAFLYAAE